jgi:hypothetical protein
MRNDDVNIKGILGFLGVLAVTLMTFYFVLALMWRGFEQKARKADEEALRQAPSASAAAGRPYFPAPREQPVPLADLDALGAREDAELNSYGWINRTAGVVRIPIDRAIELLTQPPEGRP